MASNRKFIKCGLHNIQSVKNKSGEVRELINEHSLDIFVVCETWLYTDEKTSRTIIKEMCPSTHSFHHVPRPREDNRAYGGVGIFLSKAFTHIRMRNADKYSTFEYLIIDFNHNREKLKFIVVYKPPPSNQITFREQLQDLLDTLVDETRKVYICGDFNQWVDDPNDRDATLFLELMDSFNFTNNVNAPTSRSNHTLDLVLSDKDICNTRNVQVEPIQFSFQDLPQFHRFITFELDLMTNKKIKKKITFRNKANLQPDSLISKAVDMLHRRKQEPCECRLDGSLKATCCNCLTEIYNHTLRSLYEDMCPMVDKEILLTDHEPWFNSTIKEARKKRRWFEREWRKKRTIQSRELYTRSKNEVNRLIRKRKEDYFRSKVRDGKGDSKKLATLFNDLLGKTKEKMLPEHTPDLAQNFADFFKEKIDNIYNSFDNLNARGDTFFPNFSLHKFSHFEPVNWESYKSLAKSSKKSYCESDPLPMGDIMCATNVDDLLKLQLDIINNSLVNGVFPNSEKTALIKPTLKNNLDPQILSSYRPVSNLTYLSKMTEAAALQQLNIHLDKFKILPESQSAYRKFHSTETALCSVMDDLLKSKDVKKCSILILLDLSAAFDTVVHELLIDDLKAIGVDGTALEWFKNYLAGRLFQVSVKNSKSALIPLEKGVPQGSVLGPILFCIYTLELSWILKKYGVEFQFFADDTQFYFSVRNIADTKKIIDDIMRDIANWMLKKRLKLNENKTECLLIGSAHTLRQFNDFNMVSINEVPVALSDKVKDLGVIIDSELNMEEQISSVVKASNFQLKNIAQIKKYLDQDCLKMLACNLVISRVDYCNSLYYGLPNYQLRKLQIILNKAARLVTGSPIRDKITPVHMDLHWLPIKARINYKICVLTYLALKTNEPAYLKRKLHRYALPDSTQTRHAQDPHWLDQPSANQGFGSRSFSYSAPRLFNKLPNDIKNSENIVTFKKKLKTHLFKECYDPQDKVLTEQYAI